MGDLSISTSRPSPPLDEPNAEGRTSMRRAETAEADLRTRQAEPGGEGRWSVAALSDHHWSRSWEARDVAAQYHLRYDLSRDVPRWFRKTRDFEV
jgi:hypothetical protein